MYVWSCIVWKIQNFAARVSRSSSTHKIVYYLFALDKALFVYLQCGGKKSIMQLIEKHFKKYNLPLKVLLVALDGSLLNERSRYVSRKKKRCSDRICNPLPVHVQLDDVSYSSSEK